MHIPRDTKTVCTLLSRMEFLPALHHQQHITNEPGNPFSKLIDTLMYYDEKTQILYSIPKGEGLRFSKLISH